jgi:hypothetical protein
MGQVNFLQTVPNSHSFGSLENILVSQKYQPEELTKEYLLTGFKNSLKREYEIKQEEGYTTYQEPVFTSIQEIIEFLNHDETIIESFIKIIKNTLKNKLDLKCKRKMERTEVYKRLDTERDYQDLRWSPRREKNGTPDEQKPPAEWINYIEYHISKAKESVYMLNDQDALAEVRKVAALAVRCIEIHGCPERVIPEELLNA